MFSKLFLLPKLILLCLSPKDLGHVVADTAPYFNDWRFKNGDYGSYPVQEFSPQTSLRPTLTL